MRSKSMGKVFLFILSFFSLTSANFSQNTSDMIQNGFTNYRNGDYGAAVKNFDDALKNSGGTKSNLISSNDLQKYNSESGTTDATSSKKEMTTTSKKSYADVSTKELIETQTAKYISEPLEYQGDEPAKIYLYRGRTYLKMGNKEAALQDFDKAVSLDPTLSDVYFRRAVANSNVDPEKACPDLLKAIERGHPSAQALFDLICK